MKIYKGILGKNIMLFVFSKFWKDIILWLDVLGRE